ncbi:MAG: hypothetical protein AAFZ52_14565, partial [Bacteroidota bacterium]
MMRFLLLSMVAFPFCLFGQGVGQGFTPAAAAVVDSTRLVEGNILRSWRNGVIVKDDTLELAGAEEDPLALPAIQVKRPTDGPFLEGQFVRTDDGLFRAQEATATMPPGLPWWKLRIEDFFTGPGSIELAQK